MKPKSRPLILGLLMLALGLVLLVAVDNPAIRYAGGIAAVAIGMGALRHAFGLE